VSEVPDGNQQAFGPSPHRGPVPSQPGGWEQPAPPLQSTGWSDTGSDPLFGDDRSPWQPRITPSPPPQRGKLLLGLLIGALGGLLVFGGAGFAVGRLSAPDAPAPLATPSATSTPNDAANLPPYEQSQAEVNKPKFTGELATFAEGWVPYAGDCVKSGERGGPGLAEGEAVRIACEYGSALVYFVQYKSIADRDKTRIRNLGQNVDARQLTPGVAAGGEKETPSGRSSGSYIEYAYSFGEGAAARTVAGLWWDDADRPVGAYLLSYWKEELGQSWEPLRDLWGRYA
jgi:hypothetical protein